MMEQPINILYCTDVQALSGLEASIFSILKHTKNVNFFIFTMEYHRQLPDNYVEVFPIIDEDEQKRLRRLVTYLDKHSHITFIDTLEHYNEYFLHGINENDGHSSPYAPLRLIIDIVLPDIPHILYLDCDTVIQGDLRPMYFYYLEQISNASDEYCYAAYTNLLYNQCHVLVKSEMVAGVLLFDVNKAKANGLFERARYNITHNIYPWYDQSALEEAGQYIELEETYNFMKKYEYRRYEPIILHFSDELVPKIYYEKEVFYKKFPHLTYIRDGLNLFNSIR